MKILTQEELDILVLQHELWVKNKNEINKRLDIFNYDLLGFDFLNRNLTSVYFSFCKLNQANFSDSNLTNAYFANCNCNQANFSGSNLERAWFDNCSLNQANFLGSNLTDVYFGSCNLDNVNFLGVDSTYTQYYNCSLNQANFSGSNLTGVRFYDSNLNTIITDKNTLPKMKCPAEGEFIGWKKCYVYNENNKYIKNCIVKLLIPEEAKRSSAINNKCRCSKVKVLGYYDEYGSVYQLPEGWSVRSWWTICKNIIFEYKLGEVVVPDGFDENRWKECTNGIHFYMNINEVL